MSPRATRNGRRRRIQRVGKLLVSFLAGRSVKLELDVSAAAAAAIEQVSAAAVNHSFVHLFVFASLAGGRTTRCHLLAVGCRLSARSRPASLNNLTFQRRQDERESVSQSVSLAG